MNPKPERGVLSDSHRHRQQFTSWVFTDRARALRPAALDGSIGDCYGNAMIEAFWGRVGPRCVPAGDRHLARRACERV
jgi:putative transposase